MWLTSSGVNLVCMILYKSSFSLPFLEPNTYFYITSVAEIFHTEQQMMGMICFFCLR